MTDRPRCVGVDRPHYRNDCPHPVVYTVKLPDALKFACRRHLPHAIGDAYRVTVVNWAADPWKGKSDE